MQPGFRTNNPRYDIQISAQIHYKDTPQNIHFNIFLSVMILYLERQCNLNDENPSISLRNYGEN